MKENWKDIPGFEGHYQVSDLGRVKSLKRKSERIIKQFVSGKNTYKQVSLCINSKGKSFQTHKLVASAFLNHKSFGQNISGETIVIDHISGDKYDNRLINLRELSFRKNVAGKTPGVYKTKYGKYQVRIAINKKRVCLGTFDNIDEAMGVYQKKLNELL